MAIFPVKINMGGALAVFATLVGTSAVGIAGMPHFTVYELVALSLAGSLAFMQFHATRGGAGLFIGFLVTLVSSAGDQAKHA